MSKKQITINELENYPNESFGHDMLRYIALPSLLGREKEALIYFYGRNLARQFQIESMEDLQYIFEKMHWGQLEIIKEKKNQIYFYLMSDDLARRIDSPLSVDFRMEAGFIAESLEALYEKNCECSEDFNKRLYRAEFKAIIID